MPAADLSAPGWNVQHGQALWTPERGRPELAADLLLATNVNGSIFCQLTKTPFPLITARSTQDEWEIEYAGGAHGWHRRGRPPSRLACFVLPRALLGAHLGDGWRFEGTNSASWTLRNWRTGERLEGYLAP